MAKSRNDDGGHGKMTVFAFQIEGDNSTVQQGIKSMEEAFSRFGNPKVIQVAHGARPEKLHPTEKQDLSAQSESFEESDQGQIAETAKTSRQNERKYSKGKVLELSIEGRDESLASFFQKHGKPSQETRKYMAIAGWLEEQQELEAFGLDHFYTCLKHLHFEPQKDVLQPARALASQGIFEKAEGRGMYKFTGLGRERLKEMKAGSVGEDQ